MIRFIESVHSIRQGSGVKPSDTMFVWIDCEMTGLDPRVDTILEVALIITDSQLHTHATVGPLVIGHTQQQLTQMNEQVRAMHTRNNLIQAVLASNATLAQAEQKLMEAITQWCTPKTALLAGNSVWQDGQFLRAYMPTLMDYLHYRIVDVSTIKTLVCNWYADVERCLYIKEDAHRALDDIRASINELRYYREHFFLSHQQ